ncbi:YMGG-like glycine zipper-containing protein [Flavobacterium sp. MC2016-06]|jgi:hypothetical protein|uniref:YMGG-like glycine zipper-containing protein n=1 Tax=Flavobacterium sp. MC2016-06 TaxID=2676308 RepID=UPI0012BAFBE9|nr:YMGG-like glycine zipper-containing protein [Flavobacterium sp. MC2016-06]MBU3861082.1 glycine zipper family protein [Flavobacterium sp. MC2016-06]
MKALYILIVALSIVSCQNQGKADINKAKQASIDSMKVEVNKQRIIDSMKVEMAALEQKRAAEQKVVVVRQTDGTATAAPAKKKGWSSTAKGAVIGAGVGAITGAVVSKKKGEGAIIGGLAGAGVGAGTGAIIDGKKKKE